MERRKTMANGGGNNNQKDALVDLTCLAVTTTGRRPSSVSWELTIDQIIEETSNLVKSLISQVTEVTIEVNQRTGNIMAFAWLPANSDHLIDTSMRNYVGKSIPSFSKEVKELIEKFSPRETKSVIPPQKGTGNNLSAIPLDLRKVLSVLMDESGNYCKSQYGVGVKSRLELRPIFHENAAKDRKLVGISITKSTTVGHYRHPKPNPNFRF